MNFTPDVIHTSNAHDFLMLHLLDAGELCEEGLHLLARVIGRFADEVLSALGDVQF